MKINKLILLSIFVSFSAVNTANSKSRCISANANCVIDNTEVSFSQKKQMIENHKATITQSQHEQKDSWIAALVRVMTSYSMKQENGSYKEIFKSLAWNRSTKENVLNVTSQVMIGRGKIRRIDFDFPASRAEPSKNSSSVRHSSNTKSSNMSPTNLLIAASTALEAGKYGKANKWLEELLAIREAEGGESLELADALHEMGSLHLSLGKYEKAAPLFLRALSLKEKILTVEHPADAKTRAKLGDLYKAKGELDKAERFYLRALAIYEKHSGEEEKTVADIWMELGDIYLLKGLYGKAEKFYHRSTAINKKVRGVNHPVIARINAKLAEIFAHNGDLKKGEKFYLQSMAVAKKSLGESHASYARAVKKLADFYKANAHYKNAERSYQKVLQVATKAFGEKHPFVAETMQSLSGVYEQLGDYAKAEAMKTKAMNIYQ